MKKQFWPSFWVAWGIVVGIALSAHRSAPQVVFHKPSANQYERAQEQTVTIRNEDTVGSGVVVKRTSTNGVRVFVWTANHVVSETNVTRVVRVIHFGAAKHADLSFQARVIARFTNTDAALLWVDAPEEAFRGAEFSTGTPAVGSALFHVGSLLGSFDGSVTKGTLSQVGVHPDSATWPWPVTDQSDLRMCPGSSGGPVFLDSTAEVVGLVVGGPGAGQYGIGCYIPVRVIEASGAPWAVRGTSCPDDATLNALAKASAEKADEKKKPESESVKPLPSPVKPHKSFFRRAIGL
jgi:S1-C subfamily serine protease